MRNAKKTLSLVMIAIFTTFIVLSGIPTSAATTKVVAKKQTAAQKAAAAKAAAAKKAAEAKKAADAKKKADAAKKAAADAAKKTAEAKAILTDAQKAVDRAEQLTSDAFDLVGTPTDMDNAQDAVTSALEAIVKLDKDSADYKGLMARVDSANAKIEDAQAAIDENNAKIAADKAEVAAEAAADTAVKNLEAAPLVTATDVTNLDALVKAANTAIAAVKDATIADALNGRVAKVNATASVIMAKAAEAKVPAAVASVNAQNGTITVTFDKTPIAGQSVTAADFKVTVAINGGTATAVTPKVTVADKVATITVDKTAQTAAEQSVVYNVTYATGSAIAADAFKVAAAAITATATDTTKITVAFPAAVDPTKVTVALKQGAATVYTTCAFAADNKSAVLTAPVAFAAGDYTVTASGLVATDVTAPISIVAAAPKTIEITSTQYENTGAAPLTFSVKNQYGTDMGITADKVSFNAYDVTAGKTVAVANPAAGATLNIAAVAAAGDDVRVIASYNGLTVSKTVKVVAPAAPADVTLGAVSPLANTTRITVGDTGLVIPTTVKDQYGNTVKITDFSKVTVVPSDSTLVKNVAVDANGNVTFDAQAAGTVTFTAVVNASGKVATTTVTINAKAAIKTVSIASPSALIAAKDADTSLALTAVDQYGVAFTDFTQVVSPVTTSDNTIATATIVNNKLVVHPLAAGTVTLTLKDASGNVLGTITIQVQAQAKPTAITGITAPKAIEIGATETLASATDLTAVDQYGRAYTLADADYTIAPVDNTNTNVGNVGLGFTANTAGTTAFTFTLASNSAVYTATFTAVASSSIVSYTVNNAPALVLAAGDAAHQPTLAVDGKLADGTKVYLNGTKITNATSTNPAVATVDATGKISGAAAGTTTIALWNGATKIAEISVTVSAATPIATTATLTAISVATTKTVDAKTNNLTVKDQYGVDIAKNGFWASSDSTIASVNAAGTVTGVKAGTATITYVTQNGIVTTATVTVQ